MTTIPTLAELYADIVSDLEAEYGVTLPTFGKNLLRAIAAVQAAKLKLVYLLLGDVQKNIFVDTADPVAQGGTLERFGLVKLGRNPFPATQGEYTVTVTGTAGAVISAQTTFKSDDESLNPGELFILDSAYTLPASSGSISLRALTAGTEARLEVADTLTATSPIANVDQQVTVTSEDTIPQDAEDIEEYREKAIEAYRLEPQGGAATDYRVWSADAQGVEQVYPYATSGQVNEVDVYVEATIADSTDGMGTPTPAILSDVEDVIEFDPDTTLPLSERGRRPVQVTVNVQAITVLEVTIEIPNLDPTSATIQSNITTALAEFVSDIRPFISSADVVADRNDRLTTNGVIAAILNAQPASFFDTPIIEVDATPETDFQFVGGNIPFLTTVTFT